MPTDSKMPIDLKIVVGKASKLLLGPARAIKPATAPSSPRDWVVRNLAGLIVGDSIERNGWRVSVGMADIAVQAPNHTSPGLGYYITRIVLAPDGLVEEELVRFSVGRY